MLLGLYPTLFPYGVGGFDDTKRKKISHKDLTKHYLQLGCKRFVRNRTFIFVTFNMIQRHEYLKELNLMVKKSDFKNFANEISMIKDIDLENELIHLVNGNSMRKKTIIYLLSKSQISSN